MAKYLTDAIIPSLKAKLNIPSPKLTRTTLLSTYDGKPWTTYNISAKLSTFDLIHISVGASPFGFVSMVVFPPKSGEKYGEVYQFTANTLEEGMIGSDGPNIRSMDVTVQVNDASIYLQHAYYGGITSTGSGTSTATGQVRFNMYKFSQLKVIVTGIKLS